jgi:hypothetical protein
LKSIFQSRLTFLFQTTSDDTDNSFVAVTIISTIDIKKTRVDMSGLYHCIGIHNEIFSVQTFRVKVIANGKIFRHTI